MSLELHRQALVEKLVSGTAFSLENAAGTMRNVEAWWEAYKEWESRDKFLPAFREGRMTVRQIPTTGSDQYGIYEGKDPGVAFGARRGEEEKKPYPDERYRVGVKALKERMQPSMFGIDKGERLKYKHGLHDLSGSLCVPTIPEISKQVRWKWGKLDQCITIFMPMAKPVDNALFIVLNFEAKQARATVPQAYLRVTEMRRRMSRIKLAESGDIGSGLHDVSAPGATQPKFRYGMKRLPDAAGLPSGVDWDRFLKAMDYTSILPEPTKATNLNEIVISYREHASGLFPLFTTFDKGEAAFRCDPAEPSSTRIYDKRIPDLWARTVEV